MDVIDIDKVLDDLELNEDRKSVTSASSTTVNGTRLASDDTNAPRQIHRPDNVTDDTNKPITK